MQQVIFMKRYDVFPALTDENGAVLVDGDYTVLV